MSFFVPKFFKIFTYRIFQKKFEVVTFRTAENEKSLKTLEFQETNKEYTSMTVTSVENPMYDLGECEKVEHGILSCIETNTGVQDGSENITLEELTNTVEKLLNKITYLGAKTDSMDEEIIRLRKCKCKTSLKNGVNSTEMSYSDMLDRVRSFEVEKSVYRNLYERMSEKIILCNERFLKAKADYNAVNSSNKKLLETCKELSSKVDHLEDALREMFDLDEE